MKKESPAQRARAGQVAPRQPPPATEHAPRDGNGYMVPALVLVFLGIWGKFFYFQYTDFPPPRPLTNITATRVELSDGRHLAYVEMGEHASSAKHTVIMLHAWQHSRLTPFCSESLLRELKIRMVSYDRPGYGQSDPHPARTLRSDADDIRQLADALRLGDRWHLLAISMGAVPAWAALRYIPERIAGAALVVPCGNFWWPSLTAEESRATWQALVPRDRLTLRILRHLSFLVHWWMTQTVLERANWSPIGAGRLQLAASDMQLLPHIGAAGVWQKGIEEGPRQGPSESTYKDAIIFAKDWGFGLDEIDLSGEGALEGSVHIWAGAEDLIIPISVLRHAKRMHPSIEYHELEGAGHLFFFEEKFHRPILESLVVVSEVAGGVEML